MTDIAATLQNTADAETALGARSVFMIQLGKEVGFTLAELRTLVASAGGRRSVLAASDQSRVRDGYLGTLGYSVFAPKIDSIAPRQPAGT